MAVVQTNVKRMLAFSSVSHAGLHPHRRRGRGAHVPANPTPVTGCPSALLYLLLYSALVIGTFAVVTMVSPYRRRRHRPCRRSVVLASRTL